MDTSHRNNVPLCEDDDDLWYWGYSIFVPHIPNTRAYAKEGTLQQKLDELFS